ncbi:MAG: hypothetical protein QG604_831 [Candidatus Dependentiae bacterium]|nr:hypothetical protein [Candidatus Dependentiae bacterium]
MKNLRISLVLLLCTTAIQGTAPVTTPSTTASSTSTGGATTAPATAATLATNSPLAKEVDLSAAFGQLAPKLSAFTDINKAFHALGQATTLSDFQKQNKALLDKVNDKKSPITAAPLKTQLLDFIDQSYAAIYGVPMPMISIQVMKSGIKLNTITYTFPTDGGLKLLGQLVGSTSDMQFIIAQMPIATGDYSTKYPVLSTNFTALTYGIKSLYSYGQMYVLIVVAQTIVASIPVPATFTNQVTLQPITDLGKISFPNVIRIISPSPNQPINPQPPAEELLKTLNINSTATGHSIAQKQLCDHAITPSVCCATWQGALLEQYSIGTIFGRLDQSLFIASSTELDYRDLLTYYNNDPSRTIIKRWGDRLIPINSDTGNVIAKPLDPVAILTTVGVKFTTPPTPITT